MTYDSYEESKPFMQTGEEFEHTKTLNFIYDRLIEVHGENPKYDYMHKLKNAIMMVEDRESPCNKAALEPRDNDYAMSVMEKKVKVEYVQEESFKEVLKCAIDGEVFYSKDGKGEFKFDASRLLFVNHNGADMKIAHLTNHEFYRRIETPTEWWEDASEFIKPLGHSEVVSGQLLVEAAMTRKQWCDFARILLEQGE
ncbi:hypothetical protein NVP1090B_05 [Vibrio phage 1.090.B._10N.286.48.F1]|nr:hypothetical protein NVP1090B_05 [Vibrio phage 1.090.B._10N.286.48.F1]